MARGAIKISVYQPPVVPLAPQPAPRDRPVTLRTYPRWLATAVTGAATLLLHLIFFASVEWRLGNGSDKSVTPPRNLVPGGSGGEQSSDIELIFFDDQAAGHDSGTPSRSANLELLLQPITLSEPSLPDIVVDGEEAEAQEKAASTDARSSAMYDLYVRQMDARIERAWLRPRTPIVARQFSCSARIEQDTTGQVLAVTLSHCNGDARWQQSLIQAIRSASPMPFPVDSKVFRPVITLSFRGQPYSSASEPGLYEPENAVREQAK